MRGLAKRLGVLILLAAFLSAAAPGAWPSLASPIPSSAAQQLHAASDDAPEALRPAPIAPATLVSLEATPRGAPEGGQPPMLPAVAAPRLAAAGGTGKTRAYAPSLPSPTTPGCLRSRGPPSA